MKYENLNTNEFINQADQILKNELEKIRIAIFNLTFNDSINKFVD